jgi:glycosyltransferase involved in cell wall biosynthesis
MAPLERVALVHDRLDQDGGAERVLWTLHEMFPAAPIFTAMWNRRLVPRFESCDVRLSWMQRLPGIGAAPRAYAALYPIAFAQLDLDGYDLVLSSTSSFAHGVRTGPGTLHVCYCHTPSNFVWRPRSYFTRSSLRLATAPLRAWLKAWEQGAASRPDLYIANGTAVAERIRMFYDREAAVVPPAVDAFWFTEHRADDIYLVAGRLVAQKRVDLAIQACSRLGLPLYVVGSGRDAEGLKRLAGPTVRFLGRVPDAELRGLYASARALLLPGEEDFGMVPVEAQAAGTPVIAFDGGGARETVIEGVTGIRFRPQTVEGLMAGIERAAQVTWDRDRIRHHAVGFNELRFRRDMRSLIESFADRTPAAAVGSGNHTSRKDAARPTTRSTMPSPGGSHRS